MKKKLLVLAAASALTAATAVPAMALENEFHGMYKFFAYQSNFFNGNTYNGLARGADHMGEGAHSGFMAEQRARLQYIAKANDNLKLVTHFELDTRFGGLAEGYKGTTQNATGTAGNDAGNLDADQLSLETKNVYLDFNALDTNFKVGIQPWADAYKSLFLLADMTGVYATKKFDPLTVSLGWFRFDDNDTSASAGVGQASGPVGAPGKLTSDLVVADAKFAVNKDLSIGANFYNVVNDTNTTNFRHLYMAGANAAAKFGPAAVDVFGAYQFGDYNATQEISAYLAGATGKVSVGAGAVNLAAFYLSGEGSPATGDRGDFQTIAPLTTYFNPANMWLLIRSGQPGNNSTSVLGGDNTVGGRGMWGVFAGYEGKVNKLFYNANVGYAETAHARSATEQKDLGIEANAQVGYQIYDNLSASVAGAYLTLGDALGGSTTETVNGVNNADNVWMGNVQLSYAF